MVCFEDFEDVVECMQLGAVDYLPKSADRTRLVTSIRNAMKQAELQARVASLTSELRRGDGFSAIVGSSAAMQKTLGFLRRAAQTDVTVLVEGESGTGKELAARALHAESERRSWQALAEAYVVGRDALALCVALVDVRHEPMASDELMIRFLEQVGLPFVVAASKADKLGRGELSKRVSALQKGVAIGAREVLPVSAVDGTGIERLWGVIRRAAAEHRENANGGQR